MKHSTGCTVKLAARAEPHIGGELQGGKPSQVRIGLTFRPCPYLHPFPLGVGSAWANL